jgi:hypothetical protein
MSYPIKSPVYLLGLLAGLVSTSSLIAETTLKPLNSFGGNALTPGWLAPGSNSYLTTSNNERGLGWNPTSGNLILPSRNGGNFVAVIDGTTGTVVRTLNTTGLSGGTLAMIGAGVSDDGAIYVTNLQSGASAASPYKIYKWDSENSTAAPTLAFSKVLPTTSTGGWRFGDSFAVTGSGATAKFVTAGYTTGTSPAPGSATAINNNSNFMVGTLDGTNTATIYRTIPNTSTATNDYRLGLTWIDDNTIAGNQGLSVKFTDFTATADTMTTTGATVMSTLTVGSAEKGIDFTVLNGTSLMATINTNTSVISIYDVTDASNTFLLVSGTTTTGPLSGNANATSNIVWGPVLSPTSQIIYAMSTNQGIQAMVFSTIPEPSSAAALAGMFCLAICSLSRRKRR